MPLADLPDVPQSSGNTDGNSELYEAPKNESPVDSNSLKVVVDIPLQVSQKDSLRHARCWNRSGKHDVSVSLFIRKSFSEIEGHIYNSPVAHMINCVSYIKTMFAGPKSCYC